MTPAQIQQLQTSLGIPATGVWDTATNAAYTEAVHRAAAVDPNVKQYGGSNDVAAIVDAFQTGDWSGVTSLTGKPFTDGQQQAAVAAASAALAPGYEAQQTKDTADTTATLQKNAEDLAASERDRAIQFGSDKNALDQNAADQGVLFSGSRLQKQRQLEQKYGNAEADTVRAAVEGAGNTARDFAYNYGSDAARRLSSLYSLPGASTYNAGVTGGKVTRPRTLAAAYNPDAYAYQGTKPVAQTTAVQTRAAGLLANRANKLSLSGVGAKF